MLSGLLLLSGFLKLSGFHLLKGFLAEICFSQRTRRNRGFLMVKLDVEWQQTGYVN